jgi:hypothetical protein
MISLQILIGLIIKQIKTVHDYIQVMFSDGTILSVYNKYHYDGGSVLDVGGMKVESVEEAESEIVITLDDGGVLSIGMTDDDYNGPKAMVLSREGESPVIWN